MADVQITVGQSGAEKAAQDLNQVSGATRNMAGAAGEAASATDKLGGAAIAGAHTLHGVEMAAHGSARGFFTAARGAKNLLDALGAAALTGPLLIIAGLGFAVAQLVKYFNAASEAIKKLNEESEQLARETEDLKQLRLDNTAGEYDKVISQMKRATAEQEKLNASKNKMNEAETATALAQNELAEQQELSKLAPGDTEGRKAVAATYARNREGIESAASIRKAHQEQVSSAEKYEAGQGTMGQLMAKSPAQQAALENAQRVRNELGVEANIRFSHGEELKGKAAEDFDKAVKDADAKLKEEKEKSARLQEDINTALGEQKRLELEMAIADKNAVAAKVKAGATVLKITNEASVEKAEQEKKEQDAKEKAEKEAQHQKELAEKQTLAQQIKRGKGMVGALTADEHAVDKHLKLAEHGEAPEQIAAFRSGKNIDQATQNLVKSLLAEKARDEAERARIIAVLEKLTEKHDATAAY